MEILNDVEKAAVQKFVEFETMREAVKKVLLAALYTNGTLKPGEKAEPLINRALTIVHNQPEVSNEKIGADLRAMYSGIMMLEEGFKQLSTYVKVETKPKDSTNKAR
jgi:hypothetical protein